MTQDDGWEQQPGGLYLAVQRFDKTEQQHRAAAASIMRHVVQTVAQAHGAAVNEAGYRKNMRALYGGDIKLDLYLAKWELCQPSPILIGGALNWHTVGITPDGRTSRATYTEDVSIVSRQLRELIQAKPKDKQFPKEGLGACLERISLQNMLERDGMFFRYGEVNADNTKMMKTLDGNGAAIGTGAGSAVLEFKDMPADLINRWLMDVKTVHLRRDGAHDPNNFLVRWKEGQHDIRLIATRGRATSVGEPRADIRPWHNGNLPESAILEKVIASALIAIRHEAVSRQWSGVIPISPRVSPLIPLLGSRAETYQSLHTACGQELVNRTDQQRAIMQPVTDCHVHVQNDPPMLQAFTALGAKPRHFGNKPMIPGTNILRPKM